MNAFVLIMGLLTGEVPEEVMAQQEVRVERTQLDRADAYDTRVMTDNQIERVYMVPEGWDRAAWIAAVRTVDMRAPAGRR